MDPNPPNDTTAASAMASKIQHIAYGWVIQMKASTSRTLKATNSKYQIKSHTRPTHMVTGTAHTTHNSTGYNISYKCI